MCTQAERTVYTITGSGELGTKRHDISQTLQKTETFCADARAQVSQHVTRQIESHLYNTKGILILFPQLNWGQHHTSLVELMLHVHSFSRTGAKLSHAFLDWQRHCAYAAILLVTCCLFGLCTNVVPLGSSFYVPCACKHKCVL